MYTDINKLIFKKFRIFNQNTMYKLINKRQKYNKRTYSNKLLVYKSAQDNIIELILDRSDRNNLCRKVKNYKYAKYRTEKAFVNKIYNKFDETKELKSTASDMNRKFIYTKGKLVSTDYNDNINDVCTNGIHFYITKEAAFYHCIDTSNYSGPYRAWHHNGSPDIIANYVNGYKNGNYIMFHENGKIKEKCNYKNGTINGEVLNYHYNGNMQSKYKTINDSKEGLYQVWYENGNLNLEHNYINDSKHGVAKSFHKNGNICTYCTYKHDKPHGLYRQWNDKGKLIVEIMYINGTTQYNSL